MLIIGAGGFAKEILQVTIQLVEDDNKLAFYDDVTEGLGEFLFDKYRLIKNFEAARHYFDNFDCRFTLGIGGPLLRHNFSRKFEDLGGVLTSIVSPKAEIGTVEVEIGRGVNILSGVKVSNGVKIGKGCIIYYNSIVTHDVVIGEFVEVSPGVSFLGNCVIDDFCQIGAGAIILPGIHVGRKATIGAGAVVTKDVLDDSTVVGVPARILEK